MRKYYSRRHGFGYYFKLIIVLCVIASSTFYAQDVWLYFHQIDAEKILSASELKNKTFTGKVKEVKFEKLTSYLLEEHSVPIVSINFDFTNAGSAHEDEEKQGLTLMLTSLLLDGAGKYDAETFKEVCEEYGIKIGFEADNDTFSGYLHAPSQNLTKGLELLSAVLQKPRFEEEFLKLRKEQFKTSIKISLENPQAVLADEFAEFIFAGHPYSRKSINALKTIDGVNAEDLTEFMRNHFSQQNLIVGFAGDISEKDTKDILKNLFTKLPEKYAGEKMHKIELKLGGREKNIKHEAAQSVSLFVTNGTYRDAIDFYPLYLANYIFGGSGLNSRISQIIREKEGLTYGIATYLNQSDAVAMLQGSYSATPENFRKAQKLLLSEWKKMAQEGVNEKELQQAKDALVYSFNLRFASISGIASMLVGMQKYNLGKDFLEKRNKYIKAVTLDEVSAAAKKYFRVTPDFVNIGIESKENNNVR